MLAKRIAVLLSMLLFGGGCCTSKQQDAQDADNERQPILIKYDGRTVLFKNGIYYYGDKDTAK